MVKRPAPQTAAANKGSSSILRSQAQRVITRFGGVRALQVALELVGHSTHVTTIYKWTYPASRGGSDGLIPSHKMAQIKRAARLEGIVLTKEDLFPGELP